MQATVAYAAQNRLGEGPLWSVEEQALYWVDILAPAIFRWQPGESSHRQWKLPTHIGSFAFRRDGGAIIALSNGFAFFDFATGELSPLQDPEPGSAETHLNDGKCDRMGRFFAGTMDYQENRPIGNLYRYEANGALKKMKSQITISNGLGWSPDSKIMYYTDSPTRCIYAYDYDLANGTMTNERVFARDEVGFPDGLAVDAEGYVWGAKWGGWQVVRYAPDGTIDRKIQVPTAHVTSCTFGGPDMKSLYITTAWKGLSIEDRERQPLAGNVFVVETDVQGLPEPKFAG